MLHIKRRILLVVALGVSVLAGGGMVYSTVTPNPSEMLQARQRPEIVVRDFDVQVIVDGRPLDEFAARGRTYVEALEGREYQLRVRNPYPHRVAVALSVDGLNTIDAKHTTAYDASKWVIEPYGTINISGWQVSTSRARHFYFTTERDSYGAKLGQTANLGVISAVFFRERQPRLIRITPPKEPKPYERDGVDSGRGADAPAGTARNEARSKSFPSVDDESAATGIGRSVGNDVWFVSMDLESRPMSEVTIRYEYYQALVRLGIYPRPYPRPDALRRRESARGFSPEP